MNLLKNLTIKAKIRLISFSAIFILLSILFGFFSLSNYLKYNFNSMQSQELQFKNITYKITILISNLHKEILTSSILNNTDKYIIEELEENNLLIHDNFKKINFLLKHNVAKNSTNALKILDKLEIRYTSYYNMIRELPTEYKASYEDGSEILLGLNDLSTKIFEELELFTILADKTFNQRINKLETNLSDILNLFILITLFSLFIFIFSGYILRKTINESLFNLDRGIERFFSFLSQETTTLDNINIIYDDELGEIAQHVNSNISKTKGLLENEREFKKSLQSEVKKQTHKLRLLNEEIIDTQKDVVSKMGAIAESRSKETGNHVKRVATYSKLLAEKYGLDTKMCDLLYIASPMHDIGKVGIPDSILNKPGKLTFEEFEIMKSHATLGWEMLKDSPREILSAAATISHEHHERWDGNGYPNKKDGYDIHIFGRITAIADVFDALGSDRCYKKAWDLDKIINLLKEEKGKHFEPKLVELFLNNLDEFLAIRDKYNTL